jgi:hypothetical protein
MSLAPFELVAAPPLFKLNLAKSQPRSLRGNRVGARVGSNNCLIGVIVVLGIVQMLEDPDDNQLNSSDANEGHNLMTSIISHCSAMSSGYLHAVLLDWEKRVSVQCESTTLKR